MLHGLSRVSFGVCQISPSRTKPLFSSIKLIRQKFEIFLYQENVGTKISPVGLGDMSIFYADSSAKTVICKKMQSGVIINLALCLNGLISSPKTSHPI
jgi:hypothetical protein